MARIRVKIDCVVEFHDFHTWPANYENHLIDGIARASYNALTITPNAPPNPTVDLIKDAKFEFTHLGLKAELRAARKPSPAEARPDRPKRKK